MSVCLECSHPLSPPAPDPFLLILEDPAQGKLPQQPTMGELSGTARTEDLRQTTSHAQLGNDPFLLSPARQPLEETSVIHSKAIYSALVHTRHSLGTLTRHTAAKAQVLEFWCLLISNPINQQHNSREMMGMLRL